MRKLYFPMIYSFLIRNQSNSALLILRYRKALSLKTKNDLAETKSTANVSEPSANQVATTNAHDYLKEQGNSILEIPSKSITGYRPCRRPLQP